MLITYKIIYTKYIKNYFLKTYFVLINIICIINVHWLHNVLAIYYIMHSCILYTNTIYNYISTFFKCT